MKNTFFSFSLLLLCFLIVSCSNDDSLKVPQDVEVKDFVWKGLNLYYLWQGDSPDLQDTRFSTQNQLNAFLRGFSSPEALFSHLTVDSSIDRFSVITNDYLQLEAVLSGTERTNGVDFQLFRKTPGSDEIFGFVRYILPNTDAAGKPISRGDIFYAVNGTPLTVQNQSSLLGADTYTLNMADYAGGAITPNGNSVTLTKANYSENPVYLTNTFDLGSKKVGYLMYNGFTASFDGQLNQAFGQFQSAGITHLVVDLRYNSGGSVTSATRLASMITGQFTGQIFAQQQWNQKVMDFFNENNPEQIINRFTNSLSNGTAINSLNLQKVYIITSSRSASASELLIHNLKPYIDVTVIGNTTTGKNVGSIVLYDSPTFGTQNRNPRHRYAMLPIVLRIADKNGNGDYANGIPPQVQLVEDLGNAGVLGQADEPLLQAALDYIEANGRPLPTLPDKIFVPFKNSKDHKWKGSGLIVDTPDVLPFIP